MMNRLRRLVKKYFFSPDTDPDEIEVEKLRLDFKTRYHHFKLLLSSNNKSLDIMADIEKAFQGHDTFGMSFVRASCTAASVSVFSMIKNLEKLAPGRYDELENRFTNIQGEVERILTQKKTLKDHRLILPLERVHKDMADFVGSKMANIGEIQNALGVMVPSGFVITAAAYEKFLCETQLRAEINRLIQATSPEDVETLYRLSSEIRQRILETEIPQAIKSSIHQAWEDVENKMGRRTTLALRSSALGEDTEESSFAGQYRSELNVSKESVFDSYREIVASKYSVEAITYRLNRGFKDEDIAMCVGCMTMIDAVCGGVIYTRSPVNIRDDSIYINSAWGLPKLVVDGSDVNDLLVVSRTRPLQVIREDIQPKRIKYTCYPMEGIRREELTDEARGSLSLTKQQALSLAEIAIKIEIHYGSPQDIEYAIDRDGTIYILQCRPLQQIKSSKPESPESLSPLSGETILISGGITASGGAAFGPAFLAEKAADILKFPQGGVLVVRQALPSWASLLSRAAAVITEQGGFAGHLANVAREFAVPALFGVTDAMKRLTHGEEITVDADALTIYKGKVSQLLERQEARHNLMEGSPVFETLKQVSQHIIPLHLLDPYSHEFSPKNCRTLHDITRFIHEKSVNEMFDFGKEHNFRERSSKQLYYRVPMKWWILNLDDGFREEVKGKYVHLENIASIPMLAFWHGFAAIPWDGPPPIDGKGLLAVMYQSTTNTALTTGIPTKFADRNYFMISKNYCSLSSRLGYHFSTLEALVSNRHAENYISFQFKGGAADYVRRLKRIEFIKDILEAYEFSVKVNEDNLIARIEDQEMDYMNKRLGILGYLTIHTRQLDMIMANPSRVLYYRSKITKDIDRILNIECVALPCGA